MYKGFNIIIDDMINEDVNTIDNEIEKYFQEYKNGDIDNEEYIDQLYYNSVIEDDKNTIVNNLKEFIKKDENVGEYLDFTEVKDLYFPTLKKYDIFLSHSHNDLKLVKKIALLLYHKYELIAFIDEPIWLYCNDLIKLIDVNFCGNRKDKDGNILYNYNDRNRTTAYIYTILLNALIEMIDNCDYFFFIYTGESTLKIKKDELTGTKSPWIYTEINATKLLQKKKKIKQNNKYFSEESYKDKEINTFYKLNLDHLIELNITEIVKEKNKEELINYLDNKNPSNMYKFLNKKI